MGGGHIPNYYNIPAMWPMWQVKNFIISAVLLVLINSLGDSKH